MTNKSKILKFDKFEMPQPFGTTFSSSISSIYTSINGTVNCNFIKGVTNVAIALAEAELIDSGKTITTPSGLANHIAASTATSSGGYEAFFTEYESADKPGFTQAVYYDPATGKVFGTLYDEATEGFNKYKIVTADALERTDNEAFWLAMLLHCRNEQAEILTAMEDLKSALCGDKTLADGYKALAVINYDLYFMPSKGMIKVAIDDNATMFKRISATNIEEFEPDKGKRILKTPLKVFDESAIKNKAVSVSSVDLTQFIDVDGFERKYADFSEEEKNLIPEDDPYESITTNLIYVLMAIKRSIGYANKSLRATRWILEGGAGSGKSFLVRSVARHLKRPYVTYVCGATDGPDEFLGTIMPVIKEDGHTYLATENEDEYNALMNNPNLDMDSLEVDLEFNPELAHERFKEAGLAISSLKDLAKDTMKAKDAGVSYTYIPTMISSAVKAGYILEVQEPTCLYNQAALSVLYDVLEKGSIGYLRTPGGQIKRSEDFICFFTQNRGYRGTHPLNEAARSRMTRVLKMEDPSEAEIKDRLMKTTGVNDSEIINGSYEIYKALKEAAENEGNGNGGVDGVLTLRHLQDFVMSVADGENFNIAFETCLLYPISTDEENLEILRGACDDIDFYADNIC